jgi:hypothetical protein
MRCGEPGHGGQMGTAIYLAVVALVEDGDSHRRGWGQRMGTAIYWGEADGRGQPSIWDARTDGVEDWDSLALGQQLYPRSPVISPQSPAKLGAPGFPRARLRTTVTRSKPPPACCRRRTRSHRRAPSRRPLSSPGRSRQPSGHRLANSTA